VDTHIQADPGDDGVRGEHADAGDLIELRGRVGEGGDPGLDLGDIGLGWMLPGGHGSADPGLGMNRAPGRLYLAVWLSCVRVGCGLAGTTLCASLENLEKQRQETARALMAGDLLVR
jgi:hypothetical protein